MSLIHHHSRSVSNLTGVFHSPSITPQDPTGSQEGGSSPVACSTEPGNSVAGTVPANFNACEESASLRHDVIRGLQPVQSEHPEVCSVQPTSTHRRPGDSSPAAHTGPGFPGIQPTVNPFADIRMITPPKNNEGSKGICPGESKVTTDSNRGTIELYDKGEWLTPFFSDDDANSDEVDVTEEILQSLLCLSNELFELRDQQGLILRSEIGLDGATKLHEFLDLNSCSDRLIELKDAFSEVAPGVSSSECFSQLRSAGILSNWDRNWNQAIGAPLESTFLQNRCRIMRNKRGGLVLRIEPYLHHEAKEWLKDILETIGKREYKNRSCSSTPELPKGEKK